MEFNDGNRGIYDIVCLQPEEVGTRQALKLVLVSASGMVGVAHAEHVSHVIALDDLFA